MRDRAINDPYYIRTQFDFFSVASEYASLSTTQISQTLFPHWTELNLDFKAIGKIGRRKVELLQNYQEVLERPLGNP